MRASVRLSWTLPAALLSSFALLAGCASKAPAPIQRESLREVAATVVGVKQAERLVSLRGSDERVVTLEVGPEVRNFDQIQVGDQVVASYYEAIGFALQQPGTATEPGVGIAAARSRPGERPAGAIGKIAQTTVTIESFDRSSNTVSFRGADGLVRDVPVTTDEGRAFARRLKPGDRVDITYTEAFAIRVDPGK